MAKKKKAGPMIWSGIVTLLIGAGLLFWGVKEAGGFGEPVTGGVFLLYFFGVFFVLGGIGSFSAGIKKL